MPDSTSTRQACPDCGTTFVLGDNYCRNCGMYLVIAQDVVIQPVETQALERQRASLPAPVKRAATAVAVGTVLHVGVGLAGKFLLRQAASTITHRVRPRKQDTKAVAGEPTEHRPAVVISEALYVRKTWIQRD